MKDWRATIRTVYFSKGERHWCVSVSNSHGERLDHRWLFKDVDRARRLQTRVELALLNGYELNLAYWFEADPVFGSPAYEEANGIT